MASALAIADKAVLGWGLRAAYKLAAPGSKTVWIRRVAWGRGVGGSGVDRQSFCSPPIRCIASRKLAVIRLRVLNHRKTGGTAE